MAHSTDHEHDIRQARCVVVTVSDTRTLETDCSGDTLVYGLQGQGHEIIARRIVGRVFCN